MLKILERLQSDFFVLDDGSVKCNFNLLMGFIHKYFKRSVVVSLKDKVKPLTKDFVVKYFDINKNVYFIAVGQGGERMIKYIDWVNDFQIVKAKFSRVWDKKAESSFEYDLDRFNFYNKDFVIVEDVIASGKTIEAITKYIKDKGGIVKGIISSTISGTSPLQISNDDYKIIACTSLEGDNNIIKQGSFDSHWFPGIYSLRHLFYGEEENPEFYSILADKYFKSEDIRPSLESYK